MKYFKIILIIVIAAAAIVRLLDLSDVEWLKLAGGIALILYLVLWGIEAWKKKGQD